MMEMEELGCIQEVLLLGCQEAVLCALLLAPGKLQEILH
jgi:hypothetical protein